MASSAKARRNIGAAARIAPAEPHEAWESPGFLLWHATLRWQREAAATLKPLGLTHVQFVLLGSLWWLAEHEGAPSQRELADHAGTDVMMTSQVVRALGDRGLLERVADANDARVWRLVLTDAGRDLAKRSVAAMVRLDEEFFAAAGNPGRVLGLLRRLAGRDAKGRRVVGG